MVLALLLGVSVVTCQSIHSVHSMELADNNTEYPLQTKTKVYNKSPSLIIWSYHQRADLAIQSFLMHFWNGGASCILKSLKWEMESRRQRRRMIIALNCLINSRYQLKLPIKWSYSVLELCSRVCSSPLPPTFVLIYIYLKFNILLLKVRCYSRCHRKNPYRTVSPMFSSPRSPLYVLSLLLTFLPAQFF